MGRLIVLSGPSCVGKGPLMEAVRRFYPEIAGSIRNLVIYNSRGPRPGERDGVDYHFRLRQEIEQFRGRDDFLVMEIRGDLQAVDLSAMEHCLARGDLFFEANPVMIDAMITHGIYDKTNTLSIFLSPLSREEIEFLKAVKPKIALGEFITDLMRRKLLRRTQRQKAILSLPDLQNIEVRAASALMEMRFATLYDHVLPNHDGEDCDNWYASYHPIGDARKAMAAFAQLLQGKTPHIAETWPDNLLST